MKNKKRVSFYEAIFMLKSVCVCVCEYKVKYLFSIIQLGLEVFNNFNEFHCREVEEKTASYVFYVLYVYIIHQQHLY